MKVRFLLSFLVSFLVLAPGRNAAAQRRRSPRRVLPSKPPVLRPAVRAPPPPPPLCGSGRSCGPTALRLEVDAVGGYSVSLDRTAAATFANAPWGGVALAIASGPLFLSVRGAYERSDGDVMILRAYAFERTTEVWRADFEAGGRLELSRAFSVRLSAGGGLGWVSFSLTSKATAKTFSASGPLPYLIASILPMVRMSPHLAFGLQAAFVAHPYIPRIDEDFIGISSGVLFQTSCVVNFTL